MDNLFEKLKKWWKAEDPAAPAHGPLKPGESGDWVVLPYRLAEACRISICTVGSHPDVPEGVRVWIAQWVDLYNANLSTYFRENYGPDIFPILEQITNKVWALSEKHNSEQANTITEGSFQRWEEELDSGQPGHPDTPSTG